MGTEREDEEKEGSGFTVSDKRRFNPDGSPRPGAPEREETTPRASADETPPRGTAVPPPEPPPFSARPGSDSGSDPSADFAGLIISLAQTAMIDLGAAPHPDTGEVQPDLRLARQSIDMVAMLKDKTRGNLTDEESRLLDGVLYQLRLAFLEARRRTEGGEEK